MTDRTIADLPAAAPLDGSETLPLTQGGTTKRITVAELAAMSTQSPLQITVADDADYTLYPNINDPSNPPRGHLELVYTAGAVGEEYREELRLSPSYESVTALMTGGAMGYGPLWLTGSSFQFRKPRPSGTGLYQPIEVTDTGAVVIVSMDGTDYINVGFGTQGISVGSSLYGTPYPRPVQMCIAGNTAERPTLLTEFHAGQMFWNRLLRRPEWWTGTDWRLADGSLVT